MKLGLAPVLVLVTCAACSPAPDGRSELRPTTVDDARDAGGPVRADRVEIVRGVPARGRDPGVVALAIGSTELCTGTLVSPRLVLTARHCVSRTSTRVACPPDGVQILGERSPGSIAVLAGEDVDAARTIAHGVAIVAPSGLTLCDADIALVVLDEEVTLVKPLPIRARGPARGDHVRAVGFGRSGDDGDAGRKLVREHVRVLSVTPAEFVVGEATCQGDSGGPALDEETGEIVGVVSRGGPACDGPDAHNVYTRVDAWAWLVEEAFTRAAEIEAHEDDAGIRAVKRGTKQKPPSDIGGPCEKASDCGAGVCITDGDRQYCSRSCGTGDRCPTRYHCEPVEPSGSACINVR